MCMELMINIINDDWSCLYSFSAIEGRPSLPWRVVINFVSMISDVREPILRLQRYGSLGVERLRPCTSRAVTFALKASADAIFACR
jgi:hypothetical protein